MNAVELRLQDMLKQKFPKNKFELEFTYNGRDYKTQFTAEHDDMKLEVQNACINMTCEYTVNAFIGEIQADNKERACFTPMLTTNARNKPGKRTTAADVLQILKSKLALLFPTSSSVQINDGARNDMTMISPFHILRGGDAFYEKYGYSSPAISELKKLIPEFVWSDCNEKIRSIIRDCTGVEEYPAKMPLMDVMKTISWEKETKFNTENERSLSYRVFRWFALLTKGYTFEQTNQFAVGTIWEFTLDTADRRWKQAATDLVFTGFREIREGGMRRKRKTRKQNKLGADKS
jgi:hypothetical protein